MNSINITNARQNLFQLVSDVNVGYNPITIVNSKGDNAVLISENEWKNIEETLYLDSIPGFSKSIKEIDKNEDWSKSELYDSGKEW
ncbi:MAG TPA: type II toxin-antitoxin system prevent-host-death family antitoxin [Firmicutes bacterium]|nr:type II toxin-antitoxin system prevent-host-death family antitoxin [Bacillota bacterium]